MRFTETPKTMALASFRQSVFGNWIHYLQNDPAIKDIKFQPNNQKLIVTPLYLPDRDQHLPMPSIIIHRLEENFEYARMNNVFGKIKQTINGIDKETTVSAIRLRCSYQFDVFCRDLPTQFQITGYMDNKLMGGDKYDEDLNIREGVKTNSVKSFMVKDISKRTSLTQSLDDLPDTDVFVLWRPTSVQTRESIASEKELEQFSYTVDFWCDLWYSENDDTISSINVSETRI